MLLLTPLKKIKTMKKVDVTLGKKKYTLEVAESKTELRKGLMGRESLSENEGMLFDFGTEGKHEMWMYNTLIPLD
jgi:uncharacterized membrane protein (UPF0127 family)